MKDVPLVDVRQAPQQLVQEELEKKVDKRRLFHQEYTV